MVAIDGSEHSVKAAEKALDLAKFFNAYLCAVTISYIPEVVPSGARRCIE